MKRSKEEENDKQEAQEAYEQATPAALQRNSNLRGKKGERRGSKALQKQENASAQNVEPKHSQWPDKFEIRNGVFSKKIQEKN